MCEIPEIMCQLPDNFDNSCEQSVTSYNTQTPWLLENACQWIKLLLELP